jgi:hypothetical protein
MQHLEDGSIILTPDEVAELREAHLRLRDVFQRHGYLVAGDGRWDPPLPTPPSPEWLGDPSNPPLPRAYTRDLAKATLRYPERDRTTNP